jgi:hypothetical protein
VQLKYNLIVINRLLTEHIQIVKYFGAYKLIVFSITNISAVLVYCTLEL